MKIFVFLITIIYFANSLLYLHQKKKFDIVIEKISVQGREL